MTFGVERLSGKVGFGGKICFEGIGSSSDILYERR
jgi:hypothetical protein